MNKSMHAVGTEEMLALATSTVGGGAWVRHALANSIVYSAY